MPERRSWLRDELLVAFRLYCRTPFGRLHSRNPEIVELARWLGRTPSAVAMKGCNFASLDPVQRARDIRGLSGASEADRAIWTEFEADAERIAAEAEAAYERLSGLTSAGHEAETELEAPAGPTEVERIVRTRRVQRFFRSAVLTSYDFRCAISRIAVPELLNASHIIPWGASVARRADPRNGIALNALYDRAFDRGLITFSADHRVKISPRLRVDDPPPMHRQALLDIEGAPLAVPSRFGPDPEALKFHREHVFVSAA
jgi:putative restriction endonuclease